MMSLDKFCTKLMKIQHIIDNNNLITADPPMAFVSDNKSSLRGSQDQLGFAGIVEQIERSARTREQLSAQFIDSIVRSTYDAGIPIDRLLPRSSESQQHPGRLQVDPEERLTSKWKCQSSKNENRRLLSSGL